MRTGRFSLIPASGLFIDGARLVAAIEDGRVEKRGRGYTKIICFEGRKLFVRKYIHGGLLRGVLGDLFLSERRAITEMEILNSLKAKGFPVPSALCVIAQDVLCLKRLFIVQEWIGDAEDLLECLKRSRGLGRARLIRRVAFWLSALAKEGVILRDLHLRNILVGQHGQLWFVDFDRAETRWLSAKDVSMMLMRIERYVDKMEWRRELSLDAKDRVLFLRLYKRFSGHDMMEAMRRKASLRRILYRIGWFLESILYGGRA
jgi:tRNA A-37 threonylcarbamoyl transferase component Bud32